VHEGRGIEKAEWGKGEFDITEWQNQPDSKRATSTLEPKCVVRKLNLTPMSHEDWTPNFVAQTRVTKGCMDQWNLRVSNVYFRGD
jgi:hypothetical protein